MQDTGEVYLVQHGLTGSGGGHVEVVARIADAERVEAVLSGWRDQVGEPGSLAWLRSRLGLTPEPGCAQRPGRRRRPPHGRGPAPRPAAA